MEIKKVNLSDKFNSFNDFWNPRIIAELNGQFVKVARFRDEFIMHQHEHEDEMFLVIEGTLQMELEDRTLELHPGELVVIPKGTPHKPRAVGEAKVVLFEPKTTLNTGDVDNERTIRDLDSI